MEDAESVITKLDEDFLYILHFVNDGVEKISDEEEQLLAKQWMKKLCQVYDGVSQKRLRNNYLALLVACIQTGKLTDRFLEYPSTGLLKELELLEGAAGEIPPWLQELTEEGAQVLDGRVAKEYRSYMRSKVFDNERGACVYLAVSVADEGQVPQWVNMGITRGHYNDVHMENLYKRLSMDHIGQTRVHHEPEGDDDEGGASGDIEELVAPTQTEKEIKNHILDAIGTEMAGLSFAGDDKKLEKILSKFHEFIKDGELGKSCRDLHGRSLRSYLLVQLEAHLREK